MNLGKRLQTIANFIKPCNTLADIGCDHGKLLLYLFENNIIKNAIAADISEKSVNKACILLDKNEYKNYTVYVSDGFNNLTMDEILEINCIVVAGMGGQEIIKILTDLINIAGFTNLKNIQFVLQPQHNDINLRKFLNASKFTIVNDILVKEKNKYYSVINLKYSGTMQNLSELELIFGIDNVNSYNEDFYECANEQLEKFENYYKNSKNKDKKVLEYISNLEKVINKIKGNI